MFLAADIVVKGVMVGLAVASVLVWTVWLAKTIELTFARVKLKRVLPIIGAAPSLTVAKEKLGSSRGTAKDLLVAAETELAMSEGIADAGGIERRAGSRIADIEAASIRTVRFGTGILATVGATAPFVGLFGTVWGIMNSFVGISKSQTTNLAVVAPGIAEALLATAVGLIAAIPAVILYNQLARATATYKAQVHEAASEIMRLLSRDLDRRASHRETSHARAAQ